MLVIFSGLPGTGKSTIAGSLAKQTGAIYLRIDTIEQAIRRSEKESRDMGPAGYFVAGELARDNLKMGAKVIIDSVNPLLLTRNAYRDVALSTKVSFLEIEVICSDLVQHRNRVETRTSDIQGLALPDWAAVVNREYEPWDRPHLIIDSATLSVAQSVKIITAALHELTRGTEVRG